MNWRVTALTGLAIGLPLSPALAQVYPPDYRLPPPIYYEDEDDPVVYTRRPPRGYLDERPLPDPRVAPDDVASATPGAYRPGDPPPVIYGPPDGPRPYGRQVNPPYGVSSYPDAPRPPAEIGGGAPRPGTAAIPPGDHSGTVTGSVQTPHPPGAAPMPSQPPSIMMLPPEDQPETGTPKELPPHLKRQLVDYRTKEPAGTIVVDTANTHLYFVLGNGKAIRYGIGVGREGFTWSGRETVSRKTEWPDWHPPAEMIDRQPYLPRFMAGGPGNPLGARALYLGKTLYRIHGTNQPSTIGAFVSSGCIRLLNEDIIDLYDRVKVGTPVVVLPGNPPPATVKHAPASEGEARAAQAGPASPAPVVPQ